MSVMGCFSSAAETARSWDSEKKEGSEEGNQKRDVKVVWEIRQ